MSVRDELAAIRQKHGYLAPGLVVAAARPRMHPLHGRFEWDDKIAGEAFRRHQAHRLIQSVRVSYIADERPKTIRAYTAVARPEHPQPVYEPTDELLADPVTRQIVLAQMEREWRTLLARYSDMTEFVELVTTTIETAA